MSILLRKEFEYLIDTKCFIEISNYDDRKLFTSEFLNNQRHERDIFFTCIHKKYNFSSYNDKFGTNINDINRHLDFLYNVHRGDPNYFTSFSNGTLDDKKSYFKSTGKLYLMYVYISEKNGKIELTLDPDENNELCGFVYRLYPLSSHYFDKMIADSLIKYIDEFNKELYIVPALIKIYKSNTYTDFKYVFDQAMTNEIVYNKVIDLNKYELNEFKYIKESYRKYFLKENKRNWLKNLLNN